MIMNLNQKAMIARAGNEAKMMGNDYIGSEHVLLALLRQGEAALARRAFIIFRSGRMSPSSSA